MNITALIVTKGHGERFWPRSRRSMPKQFLTITDDGKTMIQLIAERIASSVRMEDVYIAINRDYRKLVLEQLPSVPEENILCEPVGRNTAPCIGLEAVHITKKHKDVLVLVLPSDRLIKFNKMFVSTLGDACRIAEMGDNLITIGIMPDYPEAGYGCIKFSNHEMEDRAYKIEWSVGKSSLEAAKEYLATGEYLQNSGMFIWKASSILKNIKKFMPAMYKGLEQIQSAIGTDEQQMMLEQEFNKMKSQSIGYGITEQAKDIYILPGAFGQDDVGSWLTIECIRKSSEFGNVVDGNVITVNTHNCIIQEDKKLIAAIDPKDTVVVDTEDAILICEKGGTGDIKRILENLRICNRDEYIQTN